MSDTEKRSHEERVAAIKDSWRRSLSLPPNPQQEKLIDFGAHFLASREGRPGSLFDWNRADRLEMEDFQAYSLLGRHTCL